MEALTNPGWFAGTIQQWRTINLSDVKQRLAHFLPQGTRRRLFAHLLVSPAHWMGLLGFVGLMIARRFVDLRVGLISADRIGHFVADVWIRFAEESLQEHSRKVIYWPEGQVSNTFWLKLMKRNLTCHPIAKYIGHLAPYIPKSENWFLPSPRWTVRSRDVNGLVRKTGARPAFLPLENHVARNWLKTIGWVEGQPLVCVLVRDSKFLDTEPGRTPEDYGLDPDAWSYHNYRDSDIQTFVPAMKWLVSQGALVLRMGKIMETPVAVPGVFDYAFSESRSDFLDVWLFANCSMCVTTGSGPDVTSVFAGKQVVAVNHVPLTAAFTSGRVVTASKKVFTVTGRRLSLEENIDLDLHRTDDYLRRGLLMRDLSPGEILDVVKEGWLRCKGTWKTSEYDVGARERFVEAIEKSQVIVESVDLHPDATLSSEWLRVLDKETSQGGEHLHSQLPTPKSSPSPSGFNGSGA